MIIEEDKLSFKSLKALIVEKTAYAIRVPNFIEPELRKKLNSYTVNSNHEDYLHEIMEGGALKAIPYGVRRIGMPFNQTYNDKNGTITEKYLAMAQHNTLRMKEVCAPFPTPTDILIQQMNEVWWEKAEIATLNGKTMSSCICRITMPNNEILEAKPHCDTLPPHHSFSGNEFAEQLSMNIFLSTPEEGGELVTWNVPTMAPSEIQSESFMTQLNLDKAELIAIKPKPGDLILINTRRPHAVKTFKQGERISISSFFGYTEGKPLQFWS